MVAHCWLCYTQQCCHEGTAARAAYTTGCYGAAVPTAISWHHHHHPAGRSGPVNHSNIFARTKSHGNDKSLFEPEPGAANTGTAHLHLSAGTGGSLMVLFASIAQG